MAAQKTKGTMFTTEIVGEVVKVGLPIKDLLRFHKYLKVKKLDIMEKFFPELNEENGNTIFFLRVIGPINQTQKYIDDFR